MINNKDHNVEHEDVHKTPIAEFPIVGIGASAGGLEALQEFFEALPSNTNAAFVVIQHLSPDFKSYLEEIIGKKTDIPVTSVYDNIKIESNHIYIIPPKMNMKIVNGNLRLNEIIERKLNLPIDIFFRSLAECQESKSIGIIFSGTGTDGTLGIRAIKESGGITMVQDLNSAKFDGMPRSSISTGKIDFIHNPKQIAQKLIQYINHPFIDKGDADQKYIKNKSEYFRVIDILHKSKGVDFSKYKQNTLLRRLEKRISLNQNKTLSEYISFLEGSTIEQEDLFNDILIGVTNFFRDDFFFQKLKHIGLPKLFGSTNTKELRIWVTACSTGEEAYSIAMLLNEYMDETRDYRDVKIFATDLNEKSLEYAGRGIYPNNILVDVGGKRIEEFFTKVKEGYQINNNIRSKVIFAKHDLINNPPFSKIDLISCRNLLIYLSNETQERIIDTFHMSLRNKGILFLGSSESIRNPSNAYKVIDSKSKIFERCDNIKTSVQSYKIGHNIVERKINKTKEMFYYPRTVQNRKKNNEQLFESIINSVLPASVVVNEDYDILHSFNNVSNYLSIPSGEVSTNLLKMLDDELSIIVSSLLKESKDKSESIIFKDKKNNKEVLISCNQINLQKNETYFLIRFKEASSNTITKVIEPVEIDQKYKSMISDLESEIKYLNNSVQATIEELETSNEELQTNNEELIASNEELQSTNEELQSVNEELYTVNSEHMRKIDELSELNSDFDNVLSNTNMGSLFLDSNLCIRKINDVASKITNILMSDMGRPINHINLEKIYSNFTKDIEKVNNTLESIKREIYNNNTWYLMRIFPYRTLDNDIEGVIITFVEILNLKDYQSHYKGLANRLNDAIELNDMAWWEWDMEEDFVMTGEGKYRMLGYSKEEIGEGYDAWTSLLHPDYYEKCTEAMKAHISGDLSHYFVEYKIKHKQGHYIWYRDIGKINEWTKDGKPKKIVGIVTNISKDKEYEKHLEIKTKE
jgi:two-component system CheB/CheR fusion protein